MGQRLFGDRQMPLRKPSFFWSGMCETRRGILPGPFSPANVNVSKYNFGRSSAEEAAGAAASASREPIETDQIDHVDARVSKQDRYTVRAGTYRENLQQRDKGDKCAEICRPSESLSPEETSYSGRCWRLGRMMHGGTGVQ
ncbi:hypothetical protein Bbelb_124640 [Branchiostoma belcheri]|nr:hypothetical protein Bbelb_124640 [Branchiostoma belcheri]